MLGGHYNFTPDFYSLPVTHLIRSTVTCWRKGSSSGTYLYPNTPNISNCNECRLYKVAQPRQKAMQNATHSSPPACPSWVCGTLCCVLGGGLVRPVLCLKNLEIYFSWDLHFSIFFLPFYPKLKKKNLEFFFSSFLGWTSQIFFCEVHLEFFLEISISWVFFFCPLLLQQSRNFL